MRKTRTLALAGSIPLALAATLTLAAPAMAQPGPDCPTPASAPNSGSGTTQGGSCDVTGTITVGQNLAVALNFTSFTLTEADNSPSAAAGAGDVYALSNDPAGYYITLASTDYTSGSSSIPAGDVDGYTVANGFFSLSGPLNFVTSATVSGGNDTAPGTPAGWDGYAEEGFYLNTTPSVPAGSYTGTVSYTLWGN